VTFIDGAAAAKDAIEENTAVIQNEYIIHTFLSEKVKENIYKHLDFNVPSLPRYAIHSVN
jgi:hypothetical protein